jgi:hypothetical protein
VAYYCTINSGSNKASPTLPHNTYYGSRILVSHFVAWKPHIELPHRGLSTAIQPVKTCCHRVYNDGQLALEFIIGFLPLEAHTQHSSRNESQMTELDHYFSELDTNTFCMSGFMNSGYSEAGSVNSAQTGRTHNVHLPDGHVSQSWTGPLNPSLVIDGTQVEPAILDPHGIFPLEVTLDNEPLSDEASEDDACGGSLFECTWKNGQSRSSMEKEDIALLELLIRLWGLKDPWAIMEPAFMSGATRLTDYQYGGWLSKFVTWCRYEIGVIHGHTQCPSLQKTLKTHHTASDNACRRPSRKPGPSLKFARAHVYAIPPRAWKTDTDPDLRRQLFQQLGHDTIQI